MDQSLLVAVAKGDLLTVKKLVHSGDFDVNQADYDGRRALHVAARRGQVDIVQFILDSGADVNALDCHNRTPYSETRDPKVKELLGHHGANTKIDYYDVPEPNQADTARHVPKLPLGGGVGFGTPVGKSNTTTPRRSVRGGVDDAVGDERIKSDEPSIDDQGAKETSTSFLKKGLVIKKAVIALAAPFVILLVVNGVAFAVYFLLSAAIFYTIAAGYLVSEITILPPWYHHAPGGKLQMDNLPDYWSFYHNPKRDLGIDYEDVEFPASHGYTLRGWYIQGSDPTKATIMMVHGAGRDRRAWLRHVPMFFKRGYSLLLFDMREHGTSSGAWGGVTFGMYERFDVVAASKFLRERKGAVKVVALGTSAGASTCIMAAAIDPTISLVVAENPMLTAASTMEAHIGNVMGKYLSGTKPGRVTYYLFVRVCSMWLNYKIGNKPSRHCQSLHCVPKLKANGTPLFLMTGTFDNIVPPAATETLFNLASEPKELWLCPEAFHCGLYNQEPVEWERRVFGFIERNLDYNTDANVSKAVTPTISPAPGSVASSANGRATPKRRGI